MAEHVSPAKRKIACIGLAALFVWGYALSIVHGELGLTIASLLGAAGMAQSVVEQ